MQYIDVQNWTSSLPGLQNLSIGRVCKRNWIVAKLCSLNLSLVKRQGMYTLKKELCTVEVYSFVSFCKECIPIIFNGVGCSGITSDCYTWAMSASSWCAFNVSVLLYAYIPPFFLEMSQYSITSQVVGNDSSNHLQDSSYYLLLQLNLPLQRLIVPFFQSDS